MKKVRDIFDDATDFSEAADIFDQVSTGGDIFDQASTEGAPTAVTPAIAPRADLPSLQGFRPGKIDLGPQRQTQPSLRPGDAAEALKGTERLDRSFPSLEGYEPPEDLPSYLDEARYGSENLQAMPEKLGPRLGPDPLTFGSGFVKGAAKSATGGIYKPTIYASEQPGATLGQFAGGAAPAALAPFAPSLVPMVMAGQGLLSTGSEQAARAGGTLPGGELAPLETGTRELSGGILGALPASLGGSLLTRLATGAGLGGATAAGQEAITQLAEGGEINPKDLQAIQNTILGAATGGAFGLLGAPARIKDLVDYRPAVTDQAPKFEFKIEADPPLSSLVKGGPEAGEPTALSRLVYGVPEPPPATPDLPAPRSGKPTAKPVAAREDVFDAIAAQETQGAPRAADPSQGTAEAEIARPAPSQPVRGEIFDQAAAETRTEAPKLAPIVTNGRPAAPEPAERPLWEMSREELDQAYRQATASDDEILIELFGVDRAKQYKALERASNGTMDLARADAAFEKLEAMQNSLTEAQQNRLFGIGETGPAPEEIKAFRDGLDRLDDSTPENLGRSLRWAVTKVGGKTNPAEMNSQERIAFAQLTRAGEIIRENGWDSNDVSQTALRAAAQRFSDPEDALFMLERFLKKPQAAPSAPALPESPAQASLSAPDASRPAQSAPGMDNQAAGATEAAPSRGIYLDPAKPSTFLNPDQVRRWNESAARFEARMRTAKPIGAPQPPSRGAEPPSGAPQAADAPEMRERSFPKTLEENNLPGGNNRTYEAKSNAQSIERAAREIEAAGVEKSIEDVLAEVRPSAEHTTKGILLIKRLQDAADKMKATNPQEAEANYAKAVRVASDLSQKLSEQGQAIQAASIVSRLSPDGIVLYAQRQIRKANAERLFPGKTAEATMTPAQAIELRDAAKKVQDLEGYLDDSQRIAEIVNKAGKKEALTPEDLAALQDYKTKLQGIIGDEPAAPKVVAPRRPGIPGQKKSLADTLIEALDKKEQAARARLKARGYRLLSGIPVDDLADFAIIGASRLAKSGIRFTEWGAGMVKDFGEEIRPHLSKIYAKAQDYYNQERARASKLAANARAIAATLNKIDTDTSLGAEQAKALGEMVEQIKTLSGEAKIEASQELQAALQALSKPTLGQKVSSAQTIAQLLNPKTAVRNIIGNEIFYRMERLSKLVATPIDMARSKFAGTDREITFRTEGQGDYWKHFMQGARAAWRGVNPEGIQSKYDLAAPAFSGKWNPLTYMERALGVELKAFDFASYMRAKNQTLGEMAALRADQFKIPKDQRAAFVKKWIAEADENILQIADDYGKYVTFQDETGLSNAAQGVKTALNKATYAWQIENPRFGLGDMVLKYPKTPANLFLRALDYSPAGFLRSAYLIAEPVLKGGSRNTREIEMGLARAITGTLGFTGMGYYLADKGVISGRQEKDRDARAFRQEQTGERNYQVNLTALERWVRSGFKEARLKKEQGDLLVSYDWAQPISQSIATAATLNQEIANKKDPIEGAANIAAAGLGAGLESLAEQPLLQGLSDLFGGSPNSTAAERMSRILEGVPASFVPGLLNQIRQATGNAVPETYSPNPAQRALNKVIAKLPFVSKTLPEAYKTLGTSPKEQYQGGTNSLFNVFLNPAFVAKYNLDPLVEAVLTPYEAEGRTKQFPQVAKRTLTYTDDRMKPRVVDLSGRDLSALQKIMGEETQLGFFMVKPAQLAGMTFEEQEAILAKVVNKAAARARERFLQERGIQFVSRDMKRAYQASQR